MGATQLPDRAGGTVKIINIEKSVMLDKTNVV